MVAIALGISPTAFGWGYYGKFYHSGDSLGAFRFTNFTALSYQSGYGHTLSWNGVPGYTVLMFCNSAYPADFAITTGGTLNGFINYGAYKYYKKLSNSVGLLAVKPGKASYGFGAINKQQVTNRSNVDYFKSFNYSTYKLFNYRPGNNPRRYRGLYSNSAWALHSKIGSGVTSFSLIERPSSTQTRKMVHSFTIPAETAKGTYSRYIWYAQEDLSANVNSGVYIIPASSYSSFISGGSFNHYHKSANLGGVEINLPAGTYYVVAINGVNTGTIFPGSCSSIIYRYR